MSKENNKHMTIKEKYLKHIEELRPNLGQFTNFLCDTYERISKPANFSPSLNTIKVIFEDGNTIWYDFNPMNSQEHRIHVPKSSRFNENDVERVMLEQGFKHAPYSQWVLDV